MRRDHPGGDSTIRVRRDGSLLSQLAEVETAAAAANAVVQISEGLVRGQVRRLPQSAVREAIVNGVIHRDWSTDAPVVIEHVGDTLTVTSPGGFIAGITPQNIITHPSAPRYRALAEAAASLRLAEREGIGVDRMVAAMLALGHERPDISELPGPYVRTVLLGGPPDASWIELLADITPKTLTRDVDLLLMLDHLCRHGWIDAARAAPVIQRGEAEARAAIGRLSEAVFLEGIVTEVAGVPTGEPTAWRLSDHVLVWMDYRLGYRHGEARQRMILEWARARGRVSSTEVSDLAGVAQNSAGKLLTELERQGLLEPSRANRSGRGFFYRPVST
nr:ATP-binding protein [Jiangella mangrovi]